MACVITQWEEYCTSPPLPITPSFPIQAFHPSLLKMCFASQSRLRKERWAWLVSPSVDLRRAGRSWSLQWSVETMPWPWPSGGNQPYSYGWTQVRSGLVGLARSISGEPPTLHLIFKSISFSMLDRRWLVGKEMCWYIIVWFNFADPLKHQSL